MANNSYINLKDYVSDMNRKREQSRGPNRHFLMTLQCEFLKLQPVGYQTNIRTLNFEADTFEKKKIWGPFCKLD